jgi:hypothetical protein
MDLGKYLFKITPKWENSVSKTKHLEDENGHGSRRFQYTKSNVTVR